MKRKEETCTKGGHATPETQSRTQGISGDIQATAPPCLAPAYSSAEAHQNLPTSKSGNQ